MIYDQPNFAAAFRGKIPRGEVFGVVETVEGDEHCEGDGWGRVGIAAYACLSHASTVEQEPRTLPPVPRGRVTPFHYARRRKNDDSAVPFWRSRKSLQRGDEPIGELAKERDYAFVWRRLTSKGRILIDDRHRAVRERDVRYLDPSQFTGRDVLNDPLPEDLVLAWSVHWPYATARATADPNKPRAAKIAYQRELFVHPEPVRKRGVNFYRLHGEEELWLEAKEIRRFLPAPAPEEVRDDELWLDVELRQQTLALRRGEALEFVTLVSSGSYKHPTPTGLYRLWGKYATTDMRSRPNDDDSYFVESVPWVMYFAGRYALHAAFWHNRFGHTTSHGCINLSPTDARRLFTVSSPAVPGGWVGVYEHEDDPGMLVRIRKDGKPVTDKRRSVHKRFAKR